MRRYLAIHIRLHDGRYHGAGDWPPAPARLYQALVAGVGLGGPIPELIADTFRWLESLDAPEIIVPNHRTTTGYTNWVPNNDLDAKKGDPRQIGAIRTGKTIRAHIFDESQALHYLWPLQDDDKSEAEAAAMIKIAEKLYQFGRGIDMAWAVAEILNESAVSELNEQDGFSTFKPDSGSRGTNLQTPVGGSYQSLESRYQAGAKRFAIARSGRRISATFCQPPQPRFRSVSYNSPLTQLVFDLRLDDDESSPHSVPLESAVALISAIRDRVSEKLRTALPDFELELDRCFLGKNPDGSHAGTSKDRITIFPLPSIGHQHADMLIRRVAVLVPPNCPIPISDIRWAFSNLQIHVNGDISILLPSGETTMLSNYTREARVWQTITPMAVPDSASRRRIAPDRMRQEAKAAEEKAQEEDRAVAAVMQSLRHAGYRETGAYVTRVQRVPFKSNGKRIEHFSHDTRFTKERLWHVELQFSEPIAGPLILGDGRFSGLGLFVPQDGTGCQSAFRQ